MQHVRHLPHPRKVSAPAAPDLTYEWALLAATLREFAPLLHEMLQEVGHNHAHSPIDPEYQQYLGLELGGVLRFLAVRDRGVLIGFLLCTIGPHMDFISTRWASILKLYLKPSHRHGARAMKMLRMAHALMREEGVKIVTGASREGYTTPRGRRVASLWEFAGYSPLETVFVKVLE